MGLEKHIDPGSDDPFDFFLGRRRVAIAEQALAEQPRQAEIGELVGGKLDVGDDQRAGLDRSRSE